LDEFWKATKFYIVTFGQRNSFFCVFDGREIVNIRKPHRTQSDGVMYSLWFEKIMESSQRTIETFSVGSGTTKS
jgi:hypothetical protein